MQRLLICCCLLAATLLGMEASVGDDRGHEMRPKQDTDQDEHQPSMVDMRIFGGKETTIAELGGYIVSMWYNEITFVCGGTLIKDDIVLTAAQCFLNRMEKQKWRIDGGKSKLNEIGERRTIEDYVIHKNYDVRNADNDVAVVRLNKPIVGLIIHTLPLCTRELKKGNKVVVSGWGKVSRDSDYFQNGLRSVKVPIFDWLQCKKLYASGSITKTMLCAGILGKKDTCTGDAGGPMVFKNEVCGIVSSGRICGNKIYPSIYTDVYALKPFIKQAMDELLAKP